MNIAIDNGGWLLITRGKDEPAVRTESELWERLQRRLGDRWVKRVPAEDGHLTSMPFWLRERGPRTVDGAFEHLSIVDDAHMIRNPIGTYNDFHEVVFHVRDIYR